MESWDELEPAWREAFELAWEAFAAGTIPVGAVVTRGDAIIARGRNRLFDETTPPPGHIGGSRIAHAEMNAIAQLGTQDRFPDAILWTTLEPCAMCIGASWLSTIGAVRYAGSDVYAGSAHLIEAQLERADRARDDPLDVEGPLPGPFGLFGELLHVAWFVARRPEHRVTLAFRERVPDIVAIAERLRLDERTGAPLAAALPDVLDELA
jgi:tRNA(adenine34) deaminase